MSVRDDIVIDARTRDEQKKATDPSSSAWVTANAGSGKTYVLSRRVLRLLLDGADPGAVLCLTFTKAAAAQMQTRVFAELADWTQLGDAALEGKLADLLGRAPSAKEMRLARQLFARAIETPGRLKIQTIHAFCESVLQRFPFEAGVPAGFSVLDDDTSQALKTAARHDVLADPGSDALAQAIGQVSQYIDARGFGELLAAITDRRHEFQAWQHENNFDRGHVRSGLADLFGVPRSVDADAIEAEILDNAHLPRSEWRSIADTLEHARKTGTGNAVDQLRLAASAASEELARAAYLLVFLTKDHSPRKSPVTKAESEAHPDIANAILQEQARVEGLVEQGKLARLIDLTCDLAMVADAVIDRYESAKRERGMLDFADMIAHTVKLLERSTDAAWVLFKLDPGLDHILVDEAQDTSPDQWRIVRALTEEFFAGSGASEKGRTVFAVGDPKQSIYSFQGADPAGFTGMARHFEARLREAYRFERVGLFRSFRTAPAVLDAVDKVFANASTAATGVMFDNDPISHSAARERARGSVELWEPVPRPDTPDERPWDAPLDAERSDSAEATLARNIAKAIRASIDAKEILPSKGAPAQAKDFLILLRKRNRLAAPIIRALKAEGVPVAGADRLKLTDSIVTLDLMALMQATLLPEDDYSLACVLKSPLFGLNDDHLMALAIGRPGSLALALRASKTEKIHAAAQKFEELARLVRTERPYTVIAHVLGAAGGKGAYRERLGNEADDVMDELLDRALAFERDNVPTVSGFLAWLQRSGGDIKRDLDEGGGAVRVMTVHGAKGLEAPVVFVADTCSPVTSGRQNPLQVLRQGDVLDSQPFAFWDAGKMFRTPTIQGFLDEAKERSREEFHRLLYVAMTRAEDRLVICGAETGNGRGRGCWYELIETALGEQLEEIVEGRFRFVPEVEGDEPRARTAGAIAPPGTPLPKWATTPMQPAPVRTRRAASALQETAAFHAGAGQGGRARGTLVHMLLEHLPEVATERRREAGAALLAVNAPNWTDAERDALLASVMGLLEDTSLAFLFGADSRAEVPVAGTLEREDDGERLQIAGRIDRLVVTPDAILIADYKTGQPPATPEATPQAYVRQLAAYRALLGAIHPGKRVEAALVWTDAANGPAVTRLGADALCGFKVVAPD